MIYFFLILLAIIFALCGFLFHAIYFSQGAGPGRVKEILSLRQALAAREKELTEARGEKAKARSQLQSLEQQMRKRNDEMAELQRMAGRQDKEIDLLRKDAAAIRAAMTGAEKAPTLPAKPVAAPQDELDQIIPASPDPLPAPPARGPTVGPVQPESPQPPNPANPAQSGTWRDNLNNILNILDTMEKEVKK